MNTLQNILYGLFLSSAIAVAGCAQKSQSNYFPDEAGKTMPVETATVISQRKVSIKGLRENETSWGAIVGATTAGAAAYGITESDNPAGIAVTIVAAVAGALAGTLADEYRNSSDGVEYILSGENGKKFAVVQSIASTDEIVAPGTEVVIIRGSRGFVRVVPSSN
jgi:outer membrane lipoprotein SlyB